MRKRTCPGGSSATDSSVRRVRGEVAAVDFQVKGFICGGAAAAVRWSDLSDSSRSTQFEQIRQTRPPAPSGTGYDGDMISRLMLRMLVTGLLAGLAACGGGGSGAWIEWGPGRWVGGCSRRHHLFASTSEFFATRSSTSCSPIASSTATPATTADH